MQNTETGWLAYFFRNERQNVIIDMDTCNMLGVCHDRVLFLFKEGSGRIYLEVRQAVMKPRPTREIWDEETRSIRQEEYGQHELDVEKTLNGEDLTLNRCWWYR